MIRILVDSSSDYTQKEIKEKDLWMVPLQVAFEEKVYMDGITILKDEFYDKLISYDWFPKTSQPSPQAFLDYFEKAKEAGDTVLCILLSSALSGTYQSALLAKNMVEYDSIYLVDSLSATAGVRILVSTAQYLIQEGKKVEEIVEILESIKGKIRIFAAVDTLEYLCKGGRVSKTAAAIGEMTNIKPVITVNQEGKVEVIGKRLGINKTISYILKKLEESQPDLNYPFYTLYTYGTENLDKLIHRLEKEEYPIYHHLQLGAVIGTHIGPNAFGICYIEK